MITGSAGFSASKLRTNSKPDITGKLTSVMTMSKSCTAKALRASSALSVATILTVVLHEQLSRNLAHDGIVFDVKDSHARGHGVLIWQG